MLLVSSLARQTALLCLGLEDSHTQKCNVHPALLTTVCTNTSEKLSTSPIYSSSPAPLKFRYKQAHEHSFLKPLACVHTTWTMSPRVLHKIWASRGLETFESIVIGRLHCSSSLCHLVASASSFLLLFPGLNSDASSESTTWETMALDVPPLCQKSLQ